MLYYIILVMHFTHYISLIVESQKIPLDYFTKFTLILSALCHDVGHTGRTNLYEINSLSNLAIRYHDKSVIKL